MKTMRLSLMNRRRAGAAAPYSVELLHNGATFNVSNVLAHGTHADGSPWVTGSGITIDSTLPAAGVVSRSGSFAGSPTSVASHGMQFAPGRAATQDTLSAMQTSNDGRNSSQGYDNLLIDGVNDSPYDAALALGEPYSASPGVYAKAVSKLTGVATVGRPVLEGMGVLTVYASNPGGNKFRPGFAGNGTPVGYGPADLDLSSLLNLASAGYGGAFPTYAQAVELLSSRVNTEQCTYNVSTRNIIATPDVGYAGLTNDTYAGSYYETVANIALALHFDFYSAAEKRVLAGLIVQTAIDYAERSAQGGVWQDNGGHSHGRQEVVALAAIWTAGLGDSRFTDALARTTTRFVFGGGSASIWGSDREIFTITADDVARVKMFPYTAGQIGYPEWSSDATRDDPNGANAEEERQNSLGVATDGTTDTSGGPQNGKLIDKQNYRHIVAKAGAPFALALRMAGGVATRGNSTWFDYYDRHMTARIAAGAALPDGESNDLHPFALWAWDNHRANYGTVWPGTPATAIVLTEMPFDGYVFDADGQTSGTALIRGTGEPGAAVQARGTSAGGNLPWTSGIVAGDGTFEIAVPIASEAEMANWYVPEARYGTDDATKQTGTNTFSCGDVIAFLGQSGLAYFLDPAAFYATGYTRSLDAANLTLVLDDDTGGGVYTRKIAAGTVTNANVGSVALANLLHYLRPGRKLMLVDLAHVGTDPRALANDSNTDRNWSALQTAVDLARSGGSEIGGVVLNWYASPHATLPNMHQNWAPFLFGQTSGGATFTLGDAHTGPNWNTVVDHCLYDLDAAASAKGRGIFARARTTLYLTQPGPFFDSDGVEDNAFDEGLRMTNAARTGLLALADSSQFQAVGALMPSAHIVDYGGTEHPDVGGNAFGVPQFALMHAPAMLTQAGVTVAEPLLTDAVAVDARTIDVTVNLPNGGTLTTLRALESIAAPGTEPPHYQPVTGFQLALEGTKRPIYKTSETSYPIGYRGTVTITDSGTGTVPNRTGTVRITLEADAANGDFVTYLDGQATAVLVEPRDLDADLFLNMLIEHVPAWYDGTTEYPFCGVPVRPQTATPVFSGLAAGDPFATKAIGSDANLTGPALGVSTAALTVEFDIDISDGAELGGNEILEYASQTFRVAIDQRIAQRTITLQAEASSGTSLFGTVTSATGALPVGRRLLVASVTQNRGDGNAEYSVYVDGALVMTGTATALDTTFATGRALQIFQDSKGEIKAYSVRIWREYTATGDVSGFGAPLHEVSGAAANWNAPGTGLTKAGVDSFT